MKKKAYFIGYMETDAIFNKIINKYCFENSFTFYEFAINFIY